MKGNQTFNLLEGPYEPGTARQLILNCINEKILIFNRELLRRKISGGDTREFETEIVLLKSKQKQILDSFKSTEGTDKKSFLLQCKIDITVAL